jgi:hypothetical protein
MSRSELISMYFLEGQKFNRLRAEQTFIANTANVLAREQRITPFLSQTHQRLAGLNGRIIQDIERSNRRIFMLKLRIDGYRDNNNPNSPDNNLG